MAQANALRKDPPAQKPIANRDSNSQASTAKSVGQTSHVSDLGKRTFIFPPTQGGQNQTQQPSNILEFPSERAGKNQQISSAQTWTKKTDIKRLPELFAITNQEHRAWAKEFLSDLTAVTLEGDGPREGLLEGRTITVWFNQEPHPRKLKTTTAERQQLGASQDSFLFPTDAINLFTQLAKELEVPTTKAEIILAEGNVKGEFSEGKLAASGEIYQLVNTYLYLVNGKLNELDRDAGQETKQPQTVAPDFSDKTAVVPDTAKVVTTGGSGGATAASSSEAGGQEGEPDQPTAQTSAQPTVSPSQATGLTREQQKAVNYETAWLYHHATFELFGEAGFNSQDPRFNLLRTEINKYLATNLTPEQIAETFANPVARLKALRVVYSNLAANPEFASWQALANQGAENLENKLPKPGQEAKTNPKKIASELIREELGSKLQGGKIVIDGSLLQNLGYTVDAMAIALGNPALAKQFGLPVSEKKDVLKFISSLSSDQIILIFFAGKQDKEYLAWVEANKETIGHALAGAITARSVDIAISSESIRLLGGIATEADWHNLSSQGQGNLVLEIRKTLIEADKASDGNGAEVLAKATSKDNGKAKKEFDDFALKIWSSLSPDAQLWAYSEWFGIKPGDLDYQMDPDGRLPFNPILLGINWIEFLNKAGELDKKLKELRSSDGDATKLQSIARAMQELNISAQLRDAWIKGFLAGLSKDQLAYLAKTQTIKRAERALDTAQRTLAAASPGDANWLGAVALVEDLQIILDNDKLNQNIHPALAQQYQDQVNAIKEKQKQLVELIDTANKAGADSTTFGNKQTELAQFVSTKTITLELEVEEASQMLASLGASQSAGGDGIGDEMSELASSSPMEILAGAQDYDQAVENLGPDAQTGAGQGPQPIGNLASRSANAMGKMASTAKALKNIPAALAGNPVAIANLLKDFATFWSDPENRRKVYELLGGVIGGGVGALIAIISQIMGIAGAAGGALIGGLAGGALGGFLIGGPVGAIIGAGVGGVAGGLIGNKLAAQHALNGIADLTPSQASRLASQNPQFAQSTLNQPGVNPAAGSTQLVDASGKPITQQTLAQTGQTYAQLSAPAQAGASVVAGGTTASLAGFGSLAFVGPILGLGSVYLLTIITMLTIFGAFLVPLPVGNQSATGTNSSTYLSLSKSALPKKLENGQNAEVKYLVKIRPNRGYQITILDVQDKMEFLSNKKEQPESKDPSLEPASNYLPTHTKEPFSAQTDLNYTIKMSGGRDVVINNTITLKYSVTDKQGQLVAENQTLTAQTSITIGNPKVKCWPASGTITQLPYGNFTHGKLDAYDIVAPIGTSIYTPFEGDAYQDGSLTSNGYGLYVTLETTSGHTFIFGHFSKVSSTIPKRGVGKKRVQPGDELGKMGNSGFSTAPHLHYEHVGSYSASGQRRRILDTFIPSVPTIGQMVYTCF